MRVILFGATGMVGQGVLRDLYPVFKRFVPDYVTTTEQVGRAMLAVATRGAPKRVLENADINRL